MKNEIEDLEPVEKLSKKNPKSHDSLFKWLITSFFTDFMEHYFPDVKIGRFSFIDKEFISKYEALKESLRGDIFVAVETEIDDEIQDIIIHIEHESKKSDMSERVFEYLCYAWMLKKRPVWSIVIYTDKAKWKKDVPNTFWYSFTSTGRKQMHNFEVIKVNKEQSHNLINMHSLMCRLLALVADDRKADPEKMIYEILQAAKNMEDILTDDIKLLIWQWIDFYKKIPEKTVEKIKQEVGMSYIATTITEHYQMQGRFEGKKEGKKEGIKEGIFKTARNMLKDSVPIETIKKYTGLGNEDIDRLNTIK